MNYLVRARACRDSNVDAPELRIASMLLKSSMLLGPAYVTFYGCMPRKLRQARRGPVIKQGFIDQWGTIAS